MFSFNQFTYLCEDLKKHLIGAKIVNCLQVNKKLFIEFDRKPQLKTLLLCFQKPFIRFHLTSGKIKSKPHEYLSRYLSGTTLTSIEVLNQDRIVQFEFTGAENKSFLIGEFFSKHPNCYLTDSNSNILYSLYPTVQSAYQPPPPKFHSTHSCRLLEHAEIESYYNELEGKKFFENEKKGLEKKLKKELKNNLACKNKLLLAINDCKNWKDIQHKGDLIKANLSLFKENRADLCVEDWLTGGLCHIQVDPNSTPCQEMKKHYARAKKLQRGLSPLTFQTEKTEKKIEEIELKLKELAQIDSWAKLIDMKNLVFGKKAKPGLLKQKEPKSLPCHIFQSASGMHIWVGKNAKANDRLTFHAANGNDWWLHVQGSPGPHVIIKVKKGQQPDLNTLQDAMQLALFYSKSKNQGEADISITQKKYVSRLGGSQTGKVQISKHTTKRVILNKEQCRQIMERGRH